MEFKGKGKKRGKKKILGKGGKVWKAGTGELERREGRGKR